MKLCKATFTPQRVLIVSNSSGTPTEDPGYIEAESVQRQLGCYVLRHVYKKPSKRCANEILDYFASLPPAVQHPIHLDLGISQAPTAPKVIVVGDRIMTDMLLANEMGAYGIWTTRLWKREALVLRFIERSYLFLVTRWLSFREKRKLRLIEEQKRLAKEEEPGDTGAPSSGSVEVRSMSPMIGGKN